MPRSQGDDQGLGVTSSSGPGDKGSGDEQMKGTKHDKHKPTTTLVSPVACYLEQCAMDYGARKYSVHNYRKGLSANQLIEAAKRHLMLLEAGEDSDRESEIHHLAHVRANMGMYADCLGLGTLTDDRHKDPAYLEFLAEVIYNGRMW